ncbi:MAG: tetratricopeptide repeat protein [Clostridia bacterium]|nr:tetratricopeptide repeat protein [Clostridia bacterium]
MSMSMSIFKKRPKVKGFFDGVFEGKAGGWVFRPDQPGQALTIEILHGDTVVACGLANLFRDDLLKAGVGNGCHAFSIPVDQTRHGVVGFQAREQSTGKKLPMSTPVTDSTPAGFLPVEEGREMLETFLTRQGKPAAVIKNSVTAFRSACQAQNGGELSQAQAIFRQLLTDVGGLALLYCKLGETSEQSGQWQEAHTAYRTATEFDAQFFWAQAGLGRACRQLGQLREAEDAYAMAQVLHPDDQIVAESLTALRAHSGSVESELPGSDLVARADASRRLLEAVLTEVEQRIKPRTNA